MSTWIQSADFSSKDIDHLESYDQFKLFIDNFPVEKLDEDMARIESDGGDFCPWGIGVNMESDHGMHVVREDIAKNTYAVLINRSVPRKILGIINIPKSTEETHEGLSTDAMKRVAQEYYAVTTE